MGYRINERNTGNWSLEGEVKRQNLKSKKISKSFTKSEIEMMQYFLMQISQNIELDASDLDDQYFRDNGNILIKFSRDKMEEVRSLIQKFK